jgi:hypothetical protein
MLVVESAHVRSEYLCQSIPHVFLAPTTMSSSTTDKRAAAQAAWREMARGMRKFIAIQVERAIEDGTPRDASLAYIKEQIGIAIADAAGRLCMEGQPLVLSPAECVELTSLGYAMQRPREQAKPNRTSCRRSPNTIGAQA